jgi:RNA polymerase sigma factor (sigma-70 family)
MTAGAATHDEFIARMEPHRAMLYKVAYTYCRDAETRRDLVQEMLVQLWRAFPRFDASREVKFSTWMYRIAMNVAISGFRDATRRHDEVPMGELALEIEPALLIDEALSDNLSILKRLMDELDELNRALLLMFLEGHDADEIADVLGISASNVTTRMTRLKQKLTARFAEIEREGATA